MKIFLVGGIIRDYFLGVKSNDLDYVMVLDSVEGLTLDDGFQVMKNYMIEKGFKIFLETPEMVTIRARFPENHKNSGNTADFVLARKELGYEPNSRKPKLVVGDLISDLARRDFTVNAMAQGEDGVIIDPFNGQKDLKRMVLETPLPSLITLQDDGLRLIRAFRFSITKGFTISPELKRAMSDKGVIEKLRATVSEERIREEILKMFKHNTVDTIKVLTEASNTYCPEILDICFGKNIWLEPTTKSK